MTDIAKPEDQLEKAQPKVEGTAEANNKLAEAKDVSPGTTPAELSSENEKLKTATSGKSGDKLESKINKANDLADPRHQKGAELEQAHARYIEKNRDNILILEHKSPTQGGFDNVYYDQKRDKLIITEEKNLGNENRPGYVSDISAWKDKTKMEKNLDKLSEQIDQSDLDDEIKEKALLAIQENQIEKELVVGPYTKDSESKLEQYEVNRLLRLEPKNKHFQKIPSKSM